MTCVTQNAYCSVVIKSTSQLMSRPMSITNVLVIGTVQARTVHRRGPV